MQNTRRRDLRFLLETVSAGGVSETTTPDLEQIVSRIGTCGLRDKENMRWLIFPLQKIADSKGYLVAFEIPSLC